MPNDEEWPHRHMPRNNRDGDWPEYADPYSGYITDPVGAKGQGFECPMCGGDPFLWPSGTTVVQLYSYTQQPAPPAYICAKCYPKFGETLQPGVKDDPLWVQSCDQLFAFVRDNPDGDPRYP